MGARTSPQAVEPADVGAGEVRLLAQGAGRVGARQIGHGAGMGGSTAHADPASDLPAVLLALDATVVARGPGGTREIPIGELFQGLFGTALEPAELLTESRGPGPPATGARSCPKVTQRTRRWTSGGCPRTTRPAAL